MNARHSMSTRIIQVITMSIIFNDDSEKLFGYGNNDIYFLLYGIQHSLNYATLNYFNLILSADSMRRSHRWAIRSLKEFVRTSDGYVL
jgi:hypothetical protein